MDWTGYPKNLAPDDDVDSVEALAAFLGRDPGWFESLVDTMADSTGADADQLAFAFPREWRAWSTWLPYLPAPTAAQLVDALAVIPDPPPPGDVELLPVQLARLQANAQPQYTSVTLMFREAGGHPQRTVQLLVPLPAVEVDPRLLTAPAPPGLLTVRLTVQDDA